MAGAFIQVKVDGKLVKQGLQKLSKKIPEIGRNQIYQVVLRSRTRMRKPAPRPTYPIPWDSLRQKIKVLIILRYSLGGPPYRRTDTYRNSFVIQKLQQGYALTNESDRATHLTGDAEGVGQIRMARGRYLIMRKVIDEEMLKLPSAVVEHIKIAAAEQGFKSGTGT